MRSNKFPRDFFFGAATSAHQTEGGNKNDWTEWEKANAAKLAETARKKEWPDFILKNYPNPLLEENYISGRACGHYRFFRKDFDAAKLLGHNAHRLSIEWSRVEPEKGKWNEKEIGHYREAIKALRERGIEPFVTLWHWTLPVWFSAAGGWTNNKSAEYFARYAAKMAEAFPKVKFWITLNETNVYASHAYWRGDWPPAKSCFKSFFAANRNLFRAHRKAYESIKKMNPLAEVGMAHMFIYFPRSRIKRFFWNRFFLNLLCRYLDFIGVNYYFSDRKTAEKSEFLGWPVDAEGIYFVLKEAGRYRKPIYVTENGIADARDQRRAEFIRAHLEWTKKAMMEGADVRGYFYWSLLDNFEWDKGFWPRFGLIEIDYKTLERKIRPSAYKYKKIIESGL